MDVITYPWPEIRAGLANVYKLKKLGKIYAGFISVSRKP